MGKRIELSTVYRAPVSEPRRAMEAEKPGSPTVAVRKAGAGKKKVSVPPVVSEGVEGEEPGFITIKRDRAKYNAYMRAYRAKKKVEAAK